MASGSQDWSTPHAEPEWRKRIDKSPQNTIIIVENLFRTPGGQDTEDCRQCGETAVSCLRSWDVVANSYQSPDGTTRHKRGSYYCKKCWIRYIDAEDYLMWVRWWHYSESEHWHWSYHQYWRCRSSAWYVRYCDNGRTVWHW